VGGWNWAEAVRSFQDNRSAFVQALVAETDRLGLDGVELDLEGALEVPDAQGAQFVAFASDLSAALHAKGKTVTVASYPAQWNAPNWKWWPGLMANVDGVTSMGYEQTGRNSTNGFNYADQKQHANPAHKLMIGMPGWMGTWAGNSAVEQLDWVVADGTVGVGVWDCALDDPAWQTAEVWNRLAKIRKTGLAGVAPPRPGSEAHPGLVIGGYAVPGAVDAKGARVGVKPARKWIFLPR